MRAKHMKQEPKSKKKNAIKHAGFRRLYVMFLTLAAITAVFLGMTAAEYNTRKIGFQNNEKANHYLQDVMQRVISITDGWLDW